MKAINVQSIKKLVTELIIDCISGLLMAISVQVFAVNANFAPGGLNGLGVIINYLTRLPIGLVVVCLNVPIIALSGKLLGKMFLVKSIKSMVIGAFFLDHVAVFLPGYQGSPILAAVFAGIFAGVACGLLYMEGSCTGGSDFIIMTAKKLNPHLSMGQLVQLIDGSVLILAGLVFKNIDAVLYGLIYTFISSTVVDKLMYSKGAGKIAMVVTNDGHRLCEAIDQATGRGATILSATGGYQGEEKEVVLCVCGKRQVTRIRQVVKDVDSSAFMIITEFNEVFGNGFQMLED